MTIQIWFLSGLILSLFLIQITRIQDEKTPDNFGAAEWWIMTLVFLLPPIGFLICFIAICLLFYEKLPTTKMFSYCKLIVNSLIKER